MKMAVETQRRYTLKNLATGETREFTGGEEAQKQALALEDIWYPDGVEYESKPVTEKVCPRCKGTGRVKV